MLTSIQSNSDAICQYLGQSKYSLICKHEKGLSKHEKGLSKHEKGLSEHEKGLSELNHTKMYREYITKGSKYIYIYIYIFNSCNIGTRALPDMYARCPRAR